MNILQLIRSPVDEHVGCFPCSDVTNKATVNVHVQILAWTCAFVSAGYALVYEVVSRLCATWPSGPSATGSSPSSPILGTLSLIVAILMVVTLWHFICSPLISLTQTPHSVLIKSSREQSGTSSAGQSTSTEPQRQRGCLWCRRPRGRPGRPPQGAVGRGNKRHPDREGRRKNHLCP